MSDKLHWLIYFCFYWIKKAASDSVKLFKTLGIQERRNISHMMRIVLIQRNSGKQHEKLSSAPEPVVNHVEPEPEQFFSAPVQESGTGSGLVLRSSDSDPRSRSKLPFTLLRYFWFLVYLCLLSTNTNTLIFAFHIHFWGVAGYYT